MESMSKVKSKISIKSTSRKSKCQIVNGEKVRDEKLFVKKSMWQKVKRKDQDGKSQEQISKGG